MPLQSKPIPIHPDIPPLLSHPSYKPMSSLSLKRTSVLRSFEDPMLRSCYYRPFNNRARVESNLTRRAWPPPINKTVDMLSKSCYVLLQYNCIELILFEYACFKSFFLIFFSIFVHVTRDKLSIKLFCKGVELKSMSRVKDDGVVFEDLSIISFLLEEQFLKALFIL